MARVTLYFKDSVIKELRLRGGEITIGRNPDNDIHIDNKVVSGYHAKIVDEGNHVFLEDLNSTNGTFVNNERIDGYNLKDGDKVFIGKHHIHFLADRPEDTPSPEKSTAPLFSDKTMVVDSSKIRAMAAAAEKKREAGGFRVIKGSLDQEDYQLKQRLTTIGKTENAAIRLKGFFTPKIAAMVNKNESGYFLTPTGGGRSKIKVNGAVIAGRHQLEDGDVVEVPRATLQFYQS